MTAWLPQEWCSSFVLTLGHFAWQGTLIAVVLAMTLRAVKSAGARYWLSLAALLVMAACPMVTLGWLMQPMSPVAKLDPPPVVREAPAPSPPVIPAASEAASEVASDVEQVSNLPVSPPVESLEFYASASLPPVSADAQSWWQRFAPHLTTAYLSGVAVMLLRLVVGLWGGRRLRRRVRLIDDPSLLAAMQRQAQMLGLKLLPVLAYCERVTVPTVVGVLRPMILLPLTLTSGLSPEQIESVLAHELAHLRRYDHLVNLLQRVIESLLFFHPAMWWVSHRVREEREHCCDDLVVACGAMPLDYAKSLLAIAELSRASIHSRPVAAVSLSATGAQPSNLRQRISRLLGESATPSLRVSPRALLLAIGIPVVAVIATIQSGASNPPIESVLEFGPESNGLRCRLVSVPTTAIDELPDITKTANQFARGDDVTFAVELQNVSDKPVTLIGVRHEAKGQPMFEGKLAPEFFAPHLFELEFTDADGHPIARASRVFLEMPHLLNGALTHEIAPGKSLVVQLRPAKFHAPMDHRLPPGSYRAKVRYRGPSNKALAYFKQHFPNAPRAQAWSGEVSSNEVTFMVANDPSAPKPQPLVWGAVKDGLQAAVEFRPLPGAGPTYDPPGTFPTEPEIKTIFHVKNVSDRTIKFVSESARQNDEVTATNETGETERLESRWISGWPIIVRWSLRPGEIAELHALTSGIGLLKKPGKYTLRYSINFRSLVRNNGNGDDGFPKADDWQQVLVTGDTPVTIRARAGRGAPVSALAPTAGLPNSDDETNPPNNANGDLRSNPAAGSGDPGRAQNGKQEAAGTKPALHITGRVVDAETGKVLDNIRMVPTSVDGDDTKNITWQSQYLKDFTDGRFLYETDRPWDKTRLRIEAAGYRPAITRVVNKGEVVELEIKLERQILAGVVRLPNGQPAAKAQVGLASWTNEVNLHVGKLSYGHHGEKLRKVVETDEQGRFVMPAEIDPSVLVVAHAEGYAERANAETTLARTKPVGSAEADDKPAEDTAVIELQPWGRVEGRVLMGDKPVVGAKYHVYQSRADDVHVQAGQSIETDAEGRFVVEQLPPGKHGTCQRYASSKDGKTNMAIDGLVVRFDIPSGGTTTLALGSPGRTVIGKLALPADFPHKVDWANAKLIVSLQAQHSHRWGDTSDVFEWSKFMQTDEGKLYGRDNVAIAADGSFRIEGLPPAEYELNAIAETVVGDANPAEEFVSGKKRFSVPGDASPDKVQTIDLGTIDLKPLVTRAGRGAPAPALDPTAGLPKSNEETNPPNNANGDLRSNPPAGSGNQRPAQDRDRAVVADKLEFRFQVNDSKGKPVAGAKVTPIASDHSEFMLELDRKWCPEVTTDESGVALVTISNEQFQERRFKEAAAQTGQETLFQTIESLELRVDHPLYPIWSSFFDVKDPAPVDLVEAATIDVRPRRMNDDSPLHDVMPIIAGYDASPADWLAMKEQSRKEGVLTIRRVDLSSQLATRWLRLVHVPKDGPAWFSDLIDLKPLKLKTSISLKPTLRPGVRVSGRLADSVQRPVVNGRVVAKVIKGLSQSTKVSLESDVDLAISDLTAPWMFSMETNINQDGSFVFESVPADENLQIIAFCDGWVSRSPTDQELAAYAKAHDFTTDDEGTSDDEVLPQVFRTTLPGIEPIVPMERTTDCDVTVVDETGRPIADTKVSFEPNQNWFPSGWSGEGLGMGFDSLKRLRIQFQTGVPPKLPVEHERFQAKTNARGVAVIKNLPLFKTNPTGLTQHKFSVYHENYIVPMTPDSDPSRKQTVLLRPNQIGRVTVRMKAMPPKAAKARAGRGAPAPNPTAGLPNSDNETNPPNSANGDLRSKPAAGSGNPRRAQDQPSVAKPSDIFEIAGRVIDAQGQPVAKALVVYPFGYERGTVKARSVRSETDQSGGFRLVIRKSDIPPDMKLGVINTVWAWADGHSIGVARAPQVLSREAGQPARDAKPISIQLAQPAKWTFVAKTDTGKPLVGASVVPSSIRVPNGDDPIDGYFGLHDRLPDEFVDVVKRITDADGRVSIDIIPRSQFDELEVVSKSHGTQAVRLHERAQEATLPMRPVGSLSGELVGGPAELMRGVRIHFSTSVGQSEALGVATTDQSGSFHVPAIASGSLRIATSLDPKLPWRLVNADKMTIAAGSENEIVLKVEKAIPVTGRLIVRGGAEPVGQAEVSIQSGNFTNQDTSTADERGEFKTFVVPGQDAVVQVFNLSRHSELTYPQQTQTRVMIPHGLGSFRLPDIEIPKAKTWVGRLIDQSDRPVSGKYVQAFNDLTSLDHPARTDADGQFKLRLRDDQLPNRWSALIQWNRETPNGGEYSAAEVVTSSPLVLRIKVQNVPQQQSQGNAGARPIPDSLEFPKPYPKLHGLSPDMAEPQFLEIVKQQELKSRKTVEGSYTIVTASLFVSPYNRTCF